MAETLDLLANGFSSALTLQAIAAMLLGVTLGTIFGAMPGLSATTGMALMLPICFKLDVIIGLLMLAGIYCGALYGGSISAILLGIPGTAAALPTTWDGYPLTRKGRSTEALLYGLYGSAIGGIFSAIVLMFLTPSIASIALKFGAPEMFALGIWGISMTTSVTGGDSVKGMFMAALGLLIGTVGAAPSTGQFRFTFGSMYMISGFALVPLLLGCLALPGVFSMIESFGASEAFFEKEKERKFFLSPMEMLKSAATIIRSAIVGCFVGIAPAAGPTIASMMCYNMAKQSSKNPENFGNGEPDGVWASETANNAATGGSLVFALALGIPGSAAASVLMSALIMRGIQPGPNLIKNSGSLVYTFFAGFLIVNILVWIMGHIFVQAGSMIIKTPLMLLAPAVIVLCVIGAYSSGNNMFGVYCMFAVCVVGYFLTKMKFPMSPFLLSLILCSIIESNFWTAHSLSYGNLFRVFMRPQFIILMVIAILSFCTPLIKKLFKKKNK